MYDPDNAFLPYCTGPRLYTIPVLGSKLKMPPTWREKPDLVNRTEKVIGQREAILHDDEQCADALQRLAAARGSINSLMAHGGPHFAPTCPETTSPCEEAADDLIGMVRTYLE